METILDSRKAVMTQYSIWPIALVFAASAFVVGLALGSASHPYERCTVGKGFTNPEDIGECIWLLQND